MVSGERWHEQATERSWTAAYCAFASYGPGPASTGLSGRGVPTGTMLGGILADWAVGVPEKDLDLEVEPLEEAPWWMDYGPTYKLREMRFVGDIITIPVNASIALRVLTPFRKFAIVVRKGGAGNA
ncbi:hypothetical protein ACLBWS_08170 [Brucellaceae bacterium D45D]